MAAPEGFVPWGFRFHPTDEELVVYLKRKVDGRPIEPDMIPEVDIYKCEPSELPARSFMASTHRQELEWYLLGPRDKKYPHGKKKNRATPKGHWKSTGKDRPVKQNNGGAVVGVKKTLVYHEGRAPKGVRTDWVMHEYRLNTDDNTQVSSYALCRLFNKKQNGTETQEGMHPGSGSEGIPLPPPSPPRPPPPSPPPSPPPELTAAVADGDTDMSNGGNWSWTNSQLNIFDDNYYAQLMDDLLSDNFAAAVARDTDQGNVDAADWPWRNGQLNIFED